jgi:hypothetical protein
MDRPSSFALFRGSIGLSALLALAAGCSAAATAPPSSPSPPAMAENSAMPSASAMMEHSAMPSASAMAEHSAAPSAAAPVSSGTFHKVDGTAAGTAALYHNADGTFTITFEDFSIASAAGTHVVLVTNKDVTKDSDVDTATLVDLGPLNGTSGMEEFKVPASADAMTFHTVVLWDTGMAHAIAAAPLQ